MAVRARAARICLHLGPSLRSKARRGPAHRRDASAGLREGPGTGPGAPAPPSPFRSNVPGQRISCEVFPTLARHARSVTGLELGLDLDRGCSYIINFVCLESCGRVESWATPEARTVWKHFDARLYDVSEVDVPPLCSLERDVLRHFPVRAS